MTQEEWLEWSRGVMPEVVGRRGNLILLPEHLASGYSIGDPVSDRADHTGTGAQDAAIATYANSILGDVGTAILS